MSVVIGEAYITSIIAGATHQGLNFSKRRRAM